MNSSLANLNNLQVSIRVREGLRNQEVASTLMARKARIGRNRTENRGVRGNANTHSLSSQPLAEPKSDPSEPKD